MESRRWLSTIRLSMVARVCFALLLLATESLAWAPTTCQSHVAVINARKVSPSKLRTGITSLNARLPGLDDEHVPSFDPFNFSKGSTLSDWYFPNRALPVGSAAAALLSCPAIAFAAAPKAAPDAIPSAFAAYGHYLSILVIVASIMTERLTVKPAMSIGEEKRIAIADIMTGVSGTGLLVSGYYRATAYGKGWDFYSHEPIFWLKMTFLGIFGALSLFPTITIIQRSVKIQQEGTIEPMSEKLAKRLTSILNAELSALAFIPLTASLMARGVGYIDDFPTEIVGPVFFGIVTAGGVYKYVKDAITWAED